MRFPHPRIALAACLAFTMLGLAARSEAAPAPAPSASPTLTDTLNHLKQVAPISSLDSHVDWKALSPKEKEAYVDGVVDGSGATFSITFLTQPTLTINEDAVRLRSYISTHKAELVAYLDKQFATGYKATSGAMPGLIANFYVVNNPEAAARLKSTANERWKVLQQQYPDKFKGSHEPFPSPMASKAP